MPKSKKTAWIIWAIFGLFGGHKFYLGKVGMGILYLCTWGLLGIGWIIDAFFLGNQVDLYNALQNNKEAQQSIKKEVRYAIKKVGMDTARVIGYIICLSIVILLIVVVIFG